MKILICGAGIGGLYAGNILTQKGHEVVIIEKSGGNLERGFALIIWSNGFRMLEKIGKVDAVRAVGTPAPRSHTEDANGKTLVDIDFSDVGIEIRQIVARRDIRNILIKDLDIQWNTTIKKLYTKGDATNVIFNNGREEYFDLIVAADGIHSRLRSSMIPSIRSRSMGWHGWWFWTDPLVDYSDCIFSIDSDDKSGLVFPATDSTKACAYFIVRDASRTESGNSPDSVRKQFGGMGEAASRIMSHLHDQREIFLHKIETVIAPEWYRDSIVLLGDAAHAASPVSGIGASLAMEDGYVLAEELDSTNPLPAALKQYQKRRVLRAAAAQVEKTTREMRDFYKDFLDSPI